MTSSRGTIDPWSGISPPRRSAAVTARRVDESLSWDIFWGVDADKSCLLILQHRKQTRVPSRLPELRGLEVEVRPSDGGTHDWIVIRLIEPEQREIFHRLCLDIVQTTGLAKTEKEAVSRFLNRTWRWHRLLKGRRSDKLSEEEQRGLVGELWVLRNQLIRLLGVSDAVRSWTGPLSAYKDFEIGGVFLEVKTRQGTVAPEVTISSEFQLDAGPTEVLFLYVIEVVAGLDDDGCSLTITKMAEEIRSRIAKEEPAVVDLFEERLAATGFDWEDDYSAWRWLCQGERAFRVRDGFPRVTQSMCPRGVTGLRYSISLAACGEFSVDVESLERTITKRGT